jgi:hypothetical protein
VANKTKQQERDRRAKIEAMRKAEQAKERRKSLLFIVIAAVVGLGLVAAAAIPAYLDSRDDPAKKDLASFGVSAAAASCSPPTDDPATGGNDHKPDGTVVDYAQVPPSSGSHWSAPAFPARPFYTERDRPEMEQLVHNLEHGYTILWYDDTIKGDQLDALKDIAESARNDDNVGPNQKFIVSAWDDAYGDFPEGKHVALSHWGAEQGHRQLCGKVSGAVVESFIKKFPASDAPEPNAA